MTFKAALGLGGNVGDPPAAMGNALRQLDQHCGCKITAVSRLYKTPPWGKTDQADFFNCCALVETELGPEDLLELCLGVERNMKRVRIERWGPRTIDIDVLVYDDIEVRTERLQLPHPHMTERAFVLMPLNDVASTLQVAGRTVADWLALSDRADIRVACEDTEWWRQA
ncbi:2-amino-4-hydroxy-6-hydroxymethyldihydropteridine diphosphokinase [Rhizobium halophilum]|uniref:2-amino-4-hydroxy-6- hydroxymethyldihydropteridine diphosphokinase n=1 Tax=Rhizobium halophilum TaxID=2846852 RepID=UPI001EFED264|nr:2-amino-4-hydroxy-6-hydroxymethyldihydropteridine diphosphokinase [Rhizobium halophilum]MCF6368443.1 2-amino-4-hydroxy-6-hydroxymethyldihydropteridine diphosphokinase [Rhizobium halophilum]